MNENQEKIIVKKNQLDSLGMGSVIFGLLSMFGLATLAATGAK